MYLRIDDCVFLTFLKLLSNTIATTHFFFYLIRRSNSFIIFTSKQVHLVGFPIQLSTEPSVSMNALLAFYVKYPPGVASNLSGSIDGDILVDIINGSLGKIGIDIGKTILSMSKYQMEVTTVSPTTSGIIPEESNPL